MFVKTSASEASVATGAATKMSRYYEETSLIKTAQRCAAGYRAPAENANQTLRFIRRARDLGFTVAQIEDFSCCGATEAGPVRMANPAPPTTSPSCKRRCARRRKW